MHWCSISPGETGAVDADNRKKKPKSWVRRFLKQKVGDGRSPPPDTISRTLAENVQRKSLCQVKNIVNRCTRIAKLTLEFAKNILTV